ncbi:MAG: HYR domain-containing protein, partial [Bacteroidota bacterium]|nr:HYR domain-containing protein [Bacteroidota bacterium]
ASVGPYTVVYSDGNSNFTVNNYHSDETSDDDITVSPTTTTTYALVSVEDTYGTNLTPLSSNTISITANPIPTSILVSLDPEAPICPNVNFEITATATNGNTYQVWDETGTSNLGSTPYTTSITNSTDYILKAITTEGCSAEQAFSVQIDNINPSITCPSDQNLNMDASTCNATLPDYTSMVTVSDNCTAEGSISLSQSPIAGTTLSGGHNSTQLVTITATDEMGNNANCSFTVTIIDNESPVLSNCPSNVSQDTDEGEAGAIVTWVEPSATDNCTVSGSFTWTKSHNPGDFFGVGTTTITYTATDAAGNVSSTCSFDITINDNEFPEITCPANISVNNDAGQCGAVINYTTPIGTDNFPGAVTTQTAGFASGSEFPVGITTNTFEVEDAYGNITNCSFTIEVIDNENPEITCLSDINANVDTDECTAIVTYTAPVGTDNCAGQSTIQTAGLASGSAFSVGTTTNTFLVTDASGNTAQCSFDIIITDNIDPEITCPVDITQASDAGNCSAIITYTAPIGTDNCTGVSTIQTTGLASGSTFPVGTTTNTFLVTDASGNTTSCNFDIIISDNQIPSILDCPADIAQSNDNNNCSAVVSWTEPTATDNCTAGEDFTWTKSHTPGSSFDVGTTTVSYTVEDETGNSSTSCTFDITITDNQAPDILGCPANITRSNTLDACESVVSWTEPTATDNCSSTGNIVWNKSHNPGDIFPVGTTTVTYTATDEAGNISTCNFDITVLDNQKPVISNCPSNISQSADGGSCTAVVNWIEPSATDNCTIEGNLIWTKSHTSGSTFSTGTTTVSYTVEDEAGNVSLTCSFNVTIADEVNPVASCQDITIYLDENGAASITANDIDNGSSDNCSLDELSVDISNFDCNNIGSNTVTLTATDAVSNTATCTSTVTVFDNTSPTLTPKATPTTKYVDINACTYTISGAEFDPDISDNCSVSLLQYSIDAGAFTGTDANTSLAGTSLDDGVHNIVWKATDPSGNESSTWDFNITVVDNQAPQISAMANKFRNTNVNCTYVISGTEFDVTITDNCGSGSITQTYTINAESPVTATTLDGVALNTGSNTIVWTASDGTNESTRSFTVNVTDNDAPEIQAMSNITENSAANCQATVTWSIPTVSDNCDASPTLTQVVGPSSGSTFNLGTTLIKYKAQDDTGNISYMEFNVIIENNNPPTITCPSGSPFSRSAPEGACYYSVVGTEFNPTSTSGCDVTISNDYDGTSSLEGKQIAGGTHTITWTATDASSATSTCAIVVDIDSDQDLSFTTPTGHYNHYTDGGECYYTIPGNNFDASDIPDACAGSSITVSGEITQEATTIYSGFSTLAGYQLAKGENYSVVWTIEDGTGLSISSTPFTISVFDDQEPTFTCYGNHTLSTDASENYYTVSGTEFDPTGITDNCDASFDISYTIDGSPGAGTTMGGTQLLVGSHTIVWTVEDQSGNSDDCTYIITIKDNEVPSITSTSNATRSANSGTCFYTASGGEFDPTASDNVGVTEFINLLNNSSSLDGYEFPVGTTDVIWRAKDAAGNTTTMEFTVTVSDDEAPTFDLPATATRNANSYCYYRVIGSEFNPTSISDNCTSGNFSITNDYNSYSSLAYEDLPVGTTTVIWTITDHQGNSSSESIDITVVDNIDPYISCPSFTYIRISDSGESYYTANGTELIPYNSDNCSMSSMINDYNGSSNLLNEQIPEGEHAITWTATDPSGNTETCVLNLVVTNSLYPQISCVGLQIRNTDPGECYYTINGDEFAPTIAYGSPTIEYSLNWASYTSTLDGQQISTNVAHYIRVRASWVLGGTTYRSYCGFHLIVVDNEDPSITPLADITTPTTSNCYANIPDLGTLIATDNCTSSGNLEITNNQADNYNSYYSLGTTVVTWSVTDEAGNTATYDQNVTVVDQDDPNLTCLPDDIYVEANDPSGTEYIATENEFQPHMWNNCSGITYTHDYSSHTPNTSLDNASFPVGSTTVTWTAIDGAGNTSTCTFTVHVQTTADPHISCNGPKWRTTDAGLCSYDISGTEFDVTTTTSGTSLSYQINGGSSVASSTMNGVTLNTGTNTLLWTATDGSSNTSTCSFNIYVYDNEDPVPSCPDDITTYLDASGCTKTYSSIGVTPPTVTDNCTSSENIVISNNADTELMLGTTTITWSIKDERGNYAYCTQDITVVDDINPTIDCPATDYYREFDNTEVDYYTAIGTEMKPNVDDNCSINSYTNSKNLGAYLNEETFTYGTHQVTWTAIDNSGNTETCIINIVVVESFEPLIECVDDDTRYTDLDECSFTVIGAEFDAENIGDFIHPSFALTHDYATAPQNTTLAGAEFTTGTHTVTWTGTQTINGTEYTTNCSFEIAVIDDQDPVINANPADLTFNVEPGTCHYYHELDPISASDNCSGFTITNTAPVDNYYDKGITVVRWYVEDADENVIHYDQTITVVDNEGPVISNCPSNPATTTATGSGCQSSVSWTAPTATDACSGIASFTSNYSPGDLFDIGTTSVTYTATDNEGNVSTCSFDVTVLDESPTITCVANQSANTNPGLCSYQIMGNEFDPTAFDDNCSVASVEYSYFDGTTTQTGLNTLSGVVIPKPASGTVTITWTITDNNSNETSCSFDLTITDDENPVLTVPADQTRPTDTNQDYYTASGTEFDISTESDNCDITTYYYNGTEIDPATLDGEQFPVGENTITWVTEDAAGNQSSGSFILIVKDEEDPRLLTAESGITVPNDLGDCGAIVNYTEPTFIDNVTAGVDLTITVVPSSASTGNYFDLGTTSVMYTVEDTSGNILNYYFDVTVYDDEDPTITCPSGSPFSRETDDGYDTYTAVGTEFDPSDYDDNCSATISNDYNGLSSLAGTSFPMGTTTVVWTAIDDEDNSTTCSIDVIIDDIIEPTITNCPPATVAADADLGDCHYEIMSSDYDPYGFTDNDELDKLTYSINGGAEVGTDLSTSLVGAQITVGTAGDPTTTVVWKLYDVSNNFTSCTTVFTISDTQDPTITCPGNKTKNTDSGVGYYTVTALDNWDPIVSDNCGIEKVTYAINGGSEVGTDASTTLETVQFSVGTNTVVWTAYDIHDNTNDCSFTITIEDNEAPDMTCNPITVELDATGNYTLDAADISNIGAGTSDPSEIASMSVNPDDFNCYDVGENTVTLTATDNYGNIGTCTATITVEDNIAPTALCNNLTIQLDAFGTAVITAAQLNNGSSDNCSISSISADQTSFDCTDVGVNSVTLTVTDVNGNISTCTGTVTVQDLQSPTAVCQNIVKYLDASGNTTITGSDIDNGSYDNCSNLTLTPSITTFDCTNIGNNNVTLTVTDAGGNTDDCSATVTILDNLDPVVVCQDITIQLNASGNASITVDDIDDGSTDNCGIDSRSLNMNDFTCSDVGGNTVTLTVTDVNGNSATCDATVTVDDIPATAICQDITVELDATGNASIVAADVDNGSSDACGAVSLAIDQSAFTCSDVGANTITLTVTDVNSNTSTCTSTVTVEDNVAPNMICQDLTIQLDASGNASITPEEVDNGSSDACGIADLSLDQSAFTCSDLGANTITLTATDVNGNTANCTTTITVQDNINPVAVAQDITVSLNASGNITITGNDIDNGSTDNCSIANYAASPSNFDCEDIGANTVTLTVTDPAGNTNATTCTVTIEDNTNPTAICQNITVNLDATGNASITANDINNGSSDACGIQSLTADITNFDCSNIGANTVTLTVTDINGNSSQCTSSVTIVDVTNPDITCAVTGNQAINTDTDVCTYTHPDASWDAGATDECTTISSLTYTVSGATTAVTAPNTSLSGQVFEKGTTTVIWTAEDGSGNTSQCSFTVTVTDDQNPNAICQNFTAYVDINGDVTINSTDIDNGSNDNCTNISLMISKGSSPTAWNTSLDYNCSELGTNTINLQVRDDASNISTCSSTLTILDNIAPTHDNLDDRIVTTDADECTYTHNNDDWNVFDNCDASPTITYTLTGVTTTITLPNTTLNGQVFEQGTTTVNWSAEDASGNTSTTEFDIIVNDEQNPTISCPSNITQNVASAGASSTSVTGIPNPTYDDNCSVTQVTWIMTGATTDSETSAEYNHINSGTFNVGTTTITYTAYDAAGNTQTCEFEITIDVLDGAIVTNPTSVETSEPNIADNFDVTLGSAPTGTVVLDVVSSDLTEATVSPATLTFNASNWDTPQTVTVTGVNDDVDDNDQAYIVTLSINTGSTEVTSGYYNATDVIVNGNNLDDDDAGYTVSAISGHTSENLDAQTFTIQLSTEPVDDVSLTLSSSDLTEGDVTSSTTLTFTTVNWNVDQTVTVTGIDDDIVDGDVAYQINLSNATSTDPKYSGLFTTNVAVINDDNDNAGFTVTPTSGLETTEDLGTATFDVVLTSEPATDAENYVVVIDVVSSDLTEGTVSADELTFTAANWDTPQTITITGVDDIIVDGDIPYTIQLTLDAANTTDPIYVAPLDPQDVFVTNLDNDEAVISINDVAVIEGNAGTTALSFTVTHTGEEVQAGYTVSYYSQNVNATTPSDYTPVGGSVSFDGTISETETITILVNGDEMVEPNETFKLVLSSINAPGLNVVLHSTNNIGIGTISNDDNATFAIDDQTITEGDAGTQTLTFTVTLSEDVEASNPITVDYATADNTATTLDSDYVGATGTLNFTGVAGETETIGITINGDTKVELIETFNVNLSNIQSVGLPAPILSEITFLDDSGEGTITNDDASLITITDVTENETHSGTTNFDFTVSMDYPSDAEVTVDY